MATAPWQVLYILSAFLITDVPRAYGRSLSALRKKLLKYKMLRINSWKALNSLGISAEEQMPPHGLPALVRPPLSAGLWVPVCLERIEVLREGGWVWRLSLGSMKPFWRDTALDRGLQA